MSTELEKQNTMEMSAGDTSIFSTTEKFEHWQRVAKALSSSSMIPKAYQGNVPNVIVAIELANRIGISPIMVMQNLDIIHGNPTWNSTFVIAAINSCGRFKPLRFTFVGKEGQPEFGCYAHTTDAHGEKLKGTTITFKMVTEEGWLAKSGSKWKTMPEQMFQYRAASFFGRVHAPDILKGMGTVDEAYDAYEPITIEEIDVKEINNAALNHLSTCESLDEVDLFESNYGGEIPKEILDAIIDKKRALQKTAA